MSDKVVLLVGIICELAVLIVLLRRNVWRSLPLFVAYICWNLISDLFFYILLAGPTHTYVRFYIGEAITDSVLQFAVLVELTWSVLRPVRKSLPKYAPLVIAVLLAIAALIIWPLAAMSVAKGLTPVYQVISHVQETFAILRVGFFLILACFSQLLSIGWRDRELQVATGLGVYSIASLLVAVLHSHQSPMDLAQIDWYHRLDIALSMSYQGTLAYWVWSFAAKEQERKEFSPQMQQLLLIMSGGARSSSIALTDLTSERLRKKD